MCRHLRNPRLAATCAVAFCFMFTLLGTFTYINFYLSAPPFSLTTTALGRLFVVYLIGAIVTPAAGKWIDRRHQVASASSLRVRASLPDELRRHVESGDAGSAEGEQAGVVSFSATDVESAQPGDVRQEFEEGRCVLVVAADIETGARQKGPAAGIGFPAAPDRRLVQVVHRSYFPLWWGGTGRGFFGLFW
jgi:hypothetical protein